MTTLKRPSLDAWPEVDKLWFSDFWFLRHAEDVFERPASRFNTFPVVISAAQLAEVLASLIKTVSSADALIAELQSKSWNLVADGLKRRRDELAVIEAAKTSCKEHVDGVLVDVMVAYYQSWLVRRGHEFATQHDRVYWCCRDYLSMINNDAARASDEDFPLRHRHYAAQSLAAMLRRHC